MDNIDKIEQFFKDDIKIKKLIYDASYDYRYGYSDDALSEYSDCLKKVIDYSKTMLEEMVNLVRYPDENNIYYNSENLEKSNRETDLNYLHERFKIMQEQLEIAGVDKEKLNDFYNKYISSMNEYFVQDVNSNFCAYGGGYNSILKDTKANSINEMLHALHQQMINNEYVYQGLPKVKYKEYGVSLYGNDIQPIAEEIFDKIDPEKLDGEADILSLNTKVLMLVRGSGHALSLEINPSEINSNEIEVDYFIPKVCSVEKVNLLPGVRHVDKIATQTRGAFNVKQDLAADSIVDFVKKVPTDKDLLVYNEFFR